VPRIHWVPGGTGTVKIETRLIDEMFASVMGEYMTLTLTKS
jgi:hypothetical protein